MPTVKLPLSSSLYRNVDDIELNDQASQLINGYFDEMGGTRIRPGLSEPESGLNLSLTNYQVNGMYYWAEQDLVVMVAFDYALNTSEIWIFHRKVNTYSWTPLQDFASVSALILNPTTRVSFATDGQNLFMANGGQIVYLDNTLAIHTMADLDAPQNTAQLAYLDGYILAVALNTNKVYFSDNLASTTWQSLSFFSASGGPDNIGAMRVLNREIYLFGLSSIEIWEDTGASASAPFERTPGGFIQSGCSAFESIIQTEEALFWLDNKHMLRSFSSGARRPEIVSTPNDLVIAGIEDVTDCLGDVITIDGKQLYIFTFAQAQRSLVYNPKSGEWSDWGYYDSGLSNNVNGYIRFPGNAYCYSTLTGQQFVGLARPQVAEEIDNYIGPYILESSSTADHITGSPLGIPIRIQRVTGHIDHGISKNKRCNELRVRVKRGQAFANAVYYVHAQMIIRFRDNNRPDWSQALSFDLGAPGQTDLIVRTPPLGMYRTRQWEITMSDAVPFVIADAEADIDILEH